MDRKLNHLFSCETEPVFFQVVVCIHMSIVYVKFQIPFCRHTFEWLFTLKLIQTCPLNPDTLLFTVMISSQYLLSQMLFYWCCAAFVGILIQKWVFSVLHVFYRHNVHFQFINITQLSVSGNCILDICASKGPSRGGSGI